MIIPGPAYEILVLFTFVQKLPLNAHADISTGAGRLNFNQFLHLHSCFMYASSECSGKTAEMEPSLLAYAISTKISYCKFGNFCDGFIFLLPRK